MMAGSLSPAFVCSLLHYAYSSLDRADGQLLVFVNLKNSKVLKRLIFLCSQICFRESQRMMTVITSELKEIFSHIY